MNTFFTADTHLSHSNLIKYQPNRWQYMDDKELTEFKEVEANGGKYRVSQKATERMDDDIISKWNAKIKSGDTVYHLGDFSFTVPKPFFHRLNGNINFVRGNHDKALLAHLGEAKLPYMREITVEGQFIVLCHYSLRVWNKSHHGSFALHGHSHGSLPDDPNSLLFDVGCDCHDMSPLSFEEVCHIMKRKTFKPIDHHGKDS